MITHSELNVMLQQPDVESVINYLVKFGYGVARSAARRVQKSGDLGVFASASQSLELF